MAFSGTVSQTSFTTRKVIDAAARRCKVPNQQVSGEHVATALDALYLILSNLANQGAPLWCLERTVYGLSEGVGAVNTIQGTVDVKNANLRTLQQVTGTDTSASTSRTVQFASAAAVSSIGITWSGASEAFNILRSDDGVSWETVQAVTDPAVAAGQVTWHDLDSVSASLYLRVSGSGTLNISSIYYGNTPTEIPLARLNKDDYFNLPNKAFASASPLQYWLDRRADGPIMRLWPLPSSAATSKQLVVLAHRHIMDVGDPTLEIEVPQRWLDAIVALLAARLAMEWVDVDASLIPMLDQKAATALYEAQSEESDDSPLHLLPDISAYTA